MDPETGLVNTSAVLVDWPPGMRDRYEINPLNSVANAFSYYGLTTLSEIAGWVGRAEDKDKYAAKVRLLIPLANIVVVL